MSDLIVPAEVLAELPMFSELGLDEAVLRAVQEKGYTRPTPIQAEAIPPLLEGRDLVGGSQTGTGKTAAFCLPILTRLRAHDDEVWPRCLILEPTRELAHQVYEQLVLYGKHLDLRLALLYGGVKYGRQHEQLEAHADIVIATPGRLLDHLQRKALSLKKVQTLVLDEADRMLDMGFLPDVTKILDRCATKGRQSLLFSATIPPQIDKLSKRMLTDPVEIRIGGGRQPASTISHAIYPVDERQKFDLLVAILKQLDYHSVLIFTRTKAGADIISKWLDNTGHGPVAVLHSNRTQRERDAALADFKSGKSEILVATDIVARGIDISDVSHVINYDIPQHPEDYVHRIGRTGRAEREGDAVTIYTAGEADFLKAIERFIGREIERKRLPEFDYKWSPILDDDTPQKRKRNRGFSKSHEPKWAKGRRR
jgi:ATP-dependent RNA helicase RhlE